MKPKTIIALTSLAAFSLVPAYGERPADPRISTSEKPVIDQQPDNQNRVQIALLLDTSSSMNGLIDQARTQLWKVVNTFIDARRDGEAPFVEVALYEYGNNNNSLGNDWIRLVSPMTRDLDSLSDKLFSLKTNGGEEYCGAVIQRALGDLAWDPSDKTYKVIFVAGNEPFTQGRVDARSACKEALSKDIIVNTIHCGSRQSGIEGHWHDGPALAGGDFLVINQDRKIAHIDAPQDKRIAELSLELNKTYLGYGKKSQEAKAKQTSADLKASDNAGSGAAVQRAVTKSSKNYSNISWDLVDATRDGKIDPAKLKTEELPEEMKSLQPEERKAFVEETARKRTAIQSEIQTLNKAREAHVASERKNLANDSEKTLDQAMIEITRKQATSRGFSFED